MASSTSAIKAASPYCLYAAAFCLIRSASALPMASMAAASAEPVIYVEKEPVIYLCRSKTSIIHLQQGYYFVLQVVRFLSNVNVLLFMNSSALDRFTCNSLIALLIVLGIVHEHDNWLRSCELQCVFRLWKGIMRPRKIGLVKRGKPCNMQ